MLNLSRISRVIPVTVRGYSRTCLSQSMSGKTRAVKSCQQLNPIPLLLSAAGAMRTSFAACNPSGSATFLAKKYHSIIREAEEPTGETQQHEFKAETKMLLDIVAKSLYSENEVFIRELISNASDAIEKFRYLSVSNPDGIVESDRKLEIHMETNKQDMKLIIQDKGIGMTKEELIDSLGTIAKSGSKAFVSKLQEANQPIDFNIIGQFGVGFYSVSKPVTE